MQSGRIGADEEIDDTKGRTVEEVDEMIEQREFNARTQILEMVWKLLFYLISTFHWTLEILTFFLKFGYSWLQTCCHC